MHPFEFEFGNECRKWAQMGRRCYLMAHIVVMLIVYIDTELERELQAADVTRASLLKSSKPVERPTGVGGSVGGGSDRIGSDRTRPPRHSSFGGNMRSVLSSPHSRLAITVWRLRYWPKMQICIGFRSFDSAWLALQIQIHLPFDGRMRSPVQQLPLRGSGLIFINLRLLNAPLSIDTNQFPYPIAVDLGSRTKKVSKSFTRVNEIQVRINKLIGNYI